MRFLLYAVLKRVHNKHIHELKDHTHLPLFKQNKNQTVLILSTYNALCNAVLEYRPKAHLMERAKSKTIISYASYKYRQLAFENTGDGDTSRL